MKVNMNKKNIIFIAGLSLVVLVFLLAHLYIKLINIDAVVKNLTAKSDKKIEAQNTIKEVDMSIDIDDDFNIENTLTCESYNCGNLEGNTLIKGYFNHIESFNWGEKNECNVFTVTEAPLLFRSVMTRDPESGDGSVYRINEIGQPEIILDISVLGPLEKAAVFESTYDRQVLLQVESLVRWNYKEKNGCTADARVVGLFKL